MEWQNIKKIFISGIGGIGTSALAKFFLSRGIEVVGSDLVESETTQGLEKAGVKIFYKQKEENAGSGCDLLIYSAAVPPENAERMKAKSLGIPQKSYFEVLGELSREYETIAVSGTHGKSTITAMIASILIDAGLDPSVIIGSLYSKIGGNFRAGNSRLFVVEACEYRAHMLLLKPQTVILNNIEADHLDYYKDLNHIEQTFQQYISGLRHKDNLLVVNWDNAVCRRLKLPNCRVIKYGLSSDADVWAENISKPPGCQTFNVFCNGRDAGEFEMRVPGTINIYNALAAISFALSKDVPLAIIKKTLLEYRGIWRRFEIITGGEPAIISDYGHHPTAIAETIKASREFFPGRRIFLVFQPHQKDRTKKLFSGFVESLSLADAVLVSEIYEVSGREEGIKISSSDLVEAIKKEQPRKEVAYAANLEETIVKVNSMIKKEDMVIIMGAGDVYKIAGKILN